LTSNSWFKTGDVIATRSGKWWFGDRKKELIKVNGLQVAPAELEPILLEHNDVIDSAVVGITVHGEELPREIYSPRRQCRDHNGCQDIQEFINVRVGKHNQLAGGVKFISEIPKLASGKIVRRVVREWAKRDVKGIESTVKSRI
jgi:4-coumarate--CoA ligase